VSRRSAPETVQKEEPMFAKRAAIVVLVAAATCGWSCGKKEEGIKVKSGLAARVADYKITEEAVNRRFEELPDMQRKSFKGPDGKAKFVDRLIEEHLLYRAALDAKIDHEDEVSDRMRWATINILVAEYFSRNIGGKVKVGDAEIEKYYQEHRDEFRQPPVMRAQYLLSSDSLKAVSWRKRILAGEKLTDLAVKESEDAATAPGGGDVGHFNPGGYIKGVGQSEIFSKAVENLEVGALSDVFRFERGYAIVRVSEKNPEKVQTLDDARRAISAKLHGAMSEEVYQREIERLKKKYPPENYVRDRLEQTKRTAAELWEMAQMESDPRTRIQYYRDIVNQYPNEKNAPEALFMIGFTYAEDLMDFVQARRTFDELIKKYPESGIVESAKWMSENMDKPGVKIDSPADVQRQAGEAATPPKKGK
jgi:EpsD family peptidyl-prolyl cis-trans isomerase